MFGIPNAADAFDPDQAEPDSVDIRVLVEGFRRVGVLSGCEVTASTGLTLAVAAGEIEVAGVRAAVAAGSVTLGAADAANPRFDLVTVDSAGTKSVLAGTASADPVFPGLAADRVVLAAVYLPALDSGVESSQIVDKRVILGPSAGNAVFGDGSDGTVTIVGTVTLSRDMFYDVLTVQGTLQTNGYRVFCRTRCDVAVGAVIANDGTNASLGSGGAGGVSASLLGGTVGGNGQSSTGSGAAATDAAGAAGGSGGAGLVGAGGTSTASLPGPRGGFRSLPFVVVGAVFGNNGLTRLSGGAGGGGGGGDGVNAGGGGGGGGGLVVVAAKQLLLNGTIRSRGGQGGTRGVGNVGGGGGGGGGAVLLVYNSRTGTGSTAVTGGAPGNGVGSGAAGVTGGTGTVVEIVNG